MSAIFNPSTSNVLFALVFPGTKGHGMQSATLRCGPAAQDRGRVKLALLFGCLNRLHPVSSQGLCFSLNV